MRAFLLGISASFFFAFTFILNRQMNISGGSWIWTASLRYIFMLPILFVIVIMRNELVDVIKEIKQRPAQWVVWSTIGFGLFYAPLSFASMYGASWLVAATWQITIVAGAILSPLFFNSIETKEGLIKVRNKIPRKALLMSLIILIGIILIQQQEASSSSVLKAIIGVAAVIIAAFSYPLGNRKMMELCNNRLNTIQRVFGMTLSSMPFWIVLSIFNAFSMGLPSKGQVMQSLMVAVFSGIIATILFFKATEIVRHDIHKLAIVESTQAGEVIFTLIGGILMFNDKVPTLIGFIGILLVVIGMILSGFSAS